ncbi:MAG: hypothetical protein ACTTHM_10035 [Peptoanaerobacter stomatis]|uniref:hypothetical protein n=1 Tax=Peptoanaerobacter stomatis TaxID=796937 RepID=UPI003F9F6A77
MKVLINYIRNPTTNHKEINKYSTMQLYTHDNSEWEIVEVKDGTNTQNLEFDEDNNLVDDIEKVKLKKQIEEMAETIIDNEFNDLIKGDVKNDENI